MIDFLPPSNQKFKNLSGVFSAAPYQNFIIKRLIAQFKYEPYVKGLAKTLASLIIHNIQQTENHLLKVVPRSDLGTAFIVPIPLTKKRLKQRGFNQSEEIAKELAKFLEIPLANNILLKVKETRAQVELSGKDREENLKGVFAVRNNDLIKNKNILLVDDVFTTGSTLKEAASVLKVAGAKQIWGITVARE